MNEYEKTAAELYVRRFEKEPEAVCFAPGRVNLIGEHIDYNGGRVLPCSLSLGTYAAAGVNGEGVIRVVSADSDRGFEVKLQDLRATPDSAEAYSGFGWAAYPLGVAAKLMKRGFAPGGFDMAICGDLPRGSGLSSSASLELVTCAVICRLFGVKLDGTEAALVSLEAERDCAGVNCGIMDQFVCANGRHGAAVLLDTHTLDFEYCPFELGENVLLIMNTKKPRRLAESKYNIRCAECGEALRLIGGVVGEKPCLCAVTQEELEAAAPVLGDTLFRRARHAVTENLRTLEAAHALQNGDIDRLGGLLNASHDSLRFDYEVTGKELDSIVYAARSQEGVLGARMTGAGFGGCAIAIVKRAFADAAISAITRIYKAETGYDCDIRIAETGDAPFGI